LQENTSRSRETEVLGFIAALNGKQALECLSQFKQERPLALKTGVVNLERGSHEDLLSETINELKIPNSLKLYRFTALAIVYSRRS
jgi:hypothetical protein